MDYLVASLIVPVAVYYLARCLYLVLYVAMKFFLFEERRISSKTPFIEIYEPYRNMKDIEDDYSYNDGRQLRSQYDRSQGPRSIYKGEEEEEEVYIVRQQSVYCLVWHRL